MIGETLDGRYEIIRKIGGGGMGAVFEARHKGTGRRVAVKVITGELIKNKTLVTRFEREALAAGSIETQHIVQVLDTGTDPASGMPYMVMEYLDGEDLAAVLQRHPVLPPELSLRIAAQACLGLQKAHEARVVHRDIKPGNLFLSQRDDNELVVKLLDFGIAKIKQDRVQQLEASGLTRTGHMLGSPLYMSPEQARGQKSIDHRTDIWSMGVVLYQMLTGRRPHDDVDALGELIIAICSEPPPPVQELAPWVAPEIAAIVHSALRFDPAERYPSATDMLGAIKALLPSGWSLTSEMIRAMPDEARRVVAPRVEATPSSGAHSIYRPSDPGAVGVGLDPTMASPQMPAAAAPLPQSLPPLGPVAPGAAAQPAPAPGGLYPAAAAPPPFGVTALAGAITAPPAPSQAAPSAPGSGMRRAVVGIVLSAVAAGLVLGVVALVLPSRGGSVAPAASQPAPSAAAFEAPSATPAPTRTVKLVLVPDDVAAQVDGVDVPSRNGIIEIRGPVGSVHKVRLTKGSREVTGDVTVTESGPEPPKLELTEEPHAGSAEPKAAPAPSQR